MMRLLKFFDRSMFRRHSGPGCRGRVVLLILACLTVWGAARPAVAQSDAWQPTPQVVIPTTPYNWHLVITEEFLNRFVARDTNEPGRIDDFIFGARVEGTQWSTTHLRLDLRPSMEQAYAALVLNGQVQTNTVGRTDQGSVQTLGQQEFQATKDVYFSGEEFTTRHATVSARASNQSVAASTRLDGTFLERIGRKVALSRAEQQRPQTEAYARDKVVEKVFPAFDGGIDKQLALANQQLAEQFIGRLQRVNLLPNGHRVVTTDTHLHIATRTFLTANDPAVTVPQVPLAGPHAVTVYIHESLPNGLVDRFQLQGKKTTDRELKRIFDNVENLVTGAPPNLQDEDNSNPLSGIPGMPGNLTTDIEFDAVKPLDIRFETGQVVIEIRATFRPAGQSLLPPLLVSVPLRLEPRNNVWDLIRGEIRLESTGSEPLPDIAATLIRQSIESRMPPVSFPRQLNIPNWPANVPPLQFTEARSAQGWVALSFD